MATTTNGAIPVHLTGEALKFHKPGKWVCLMPHTL